MAMTPSLSPIAQGDFGPAQARHLLWRAGFGAPASEVQALAQAGLSDAVDQLVRYQQFDVTDLENADPDPDVIKPRTREEIQAIGEARRNGDRDALDRYQRLRNVARAEDRRMHAGLQSWWLDRMVKTPRPAQEKLTLLWHSHFAARHRDIRDAYLMYQQNTMFRDNANGSFADLAAGIVRDPAMIRFLNNDRNNKRRPNENLARELMELFTLGEGNYTEADIREGARALTGYTARDNDFVFNRGQHDDGRKTILGQTSDFDGDAFAQLLLLNEACAKFIALKLYRHFVADVSDDWDLVPAVQQRVIAGMADQLRRENYALSPVLSKLFKSQHFYDTEIVGKKIKSPVQLVVGTTRALGTPMREERGLIAALRAMGQDLFEPPSVAGWDGGRAWINTSTLFLRHNTCTYLITGKDARNNWRRDNAGYDPMPMLAGLDEPTPQAVVDHLCDLMLGHHVPADRRASLVRFMEDRNKGVTADSVIALLLLITAMPEYQLC